jgi:hypothetical protein
VDAGESIKLTVEWTGAGRPRVLRAPDLGRLDSFGLPVYGARRILREAPRSDLAPSTRRSTPFLPLRCASATRAPGHHVSRDAAHPDPRARARAARWPSAERRRRSPAEPGRDLRDIDAAPALRGRARGRARPRAAHCSPRCSAPGGRLLLRAAVPASVPAHPWSGGGAARGASCRWRSRQDRRRAARAGDVPGRARGRRAWIGRDVERGAARALEQGAMPPRTRAPAGLSRAWSAPLWSREGERVQRASSWTSPTVCSGGASDAPSSGSSFLAPRGLLLALAPPASAQGQAFDAVPRPTYAAATAAASGSGPGPAAPLAPAGRAGATTSATPSGAQAAAEGARLVPAALRAHPHADARQPGFAREGSASRRPTRAAWRRPCTARQARSRAAGPRPACSRPPCSLRGARARALRG